MDLPRKILFLDVETTGLSDDDRIVSLGALELDTSRLAVDFLKVQATHLIFDPGIPSHPMALKVHGYDDWTLRHQEPFPIYARCIREIVSQCNLLVCHNIEFDLRFLSRELASAGEDWPVMPTYCTMQEERRRGLPAGLDATCRRVGIPSRGSRHSALDDAFRAMLVFLYQHRRPLGELSSIPKKPSNFRKTPKKPKGGVPERSPDTERARIESLAFSLNLLRREVIPGLLILRWITGEVLEDKKLSEILADFAASEAAELGVTVGNFPEIAVRDTRYSPCEWSDVRCALDAIRPDASKRSRLSWAIEECIRSDGEVSVHEIERLRQVAEYLGGQIAPPFVAT